METQADKSTAHDIARQVAQRLGKDWIADLPDYQGCHWAMIEHQEDKRSLNFTIKGDRVHVSASGWPSWRETTRDWRQADSRNNAVHPSDLRDPREEAPSASIAIDRGIDAICKEIARRVMAPYVAIWARCLERAKELQRAEDAKEAAWARVCQAAGVTSDKFSIDLVGGIDIRPSSASSVYADRGGSIDTGDAIAIIELMRARKASKA